MVPQPVAYLRSDHWQDKSTLQLLSALPRLRTMEGMEITVSTLTGYMEILLLLVQFHRNLIVAIRARRRRVFYRRRMMLLMLTRAYSRRSHDLRAILCISEVQGMRRWWAYPRPSVWWRNYVMRIWSDEQWLEHFRMSKSTFLYLVGALLPGLRRNNTHLRSSISPEERLAIAIWYLAETTSYRIVGQVFGVGRSTVATIVVDVCLLMEQEIYARFVRPGPPAEVGSP